MAFEFEPASEEVIVTISVPLWFPDDERERLFLAMKQEAARALGEIFAGGQVPALKMQQEMRVSRARFENEH